MGTHCESRVQRADDSRSYWHTAGVENTAYDQGNRTTLSLSPRKHSEPDFTMDLNYWRMFDWWAVRYVFLNKWNTEYNCTRHWTRACQILRPCFFKCEWPPVDLQALIAQPACCAGFHQFNRFFFREVTTSPFESVGQGWHLWRPHSNVSCHVMSRIWIWKHWKSVQWYEHDDCMKFRKREFIPLKIPRTHRGGDPHCLLIKQ